MAQHRIPDGITPEQCRLARELLGWSLVRLASRIGVSERTLQRFEQASEYKRSSLRRPSFIGLRTVLETAGIVFADVKAGQPSVILQTSSK